MTNLLQTAATWLAGQLAGSASIPATVVRGNQSAPWTVTLGSKLYRTTDRNGVTRTERAERDFIGEAATYAPTGAPGSPERGDEIQIVNGAATERWQVMALDGQPPYQDMDHQGIMIRVHTKYLGTV